MHSHHRESTALAGLVAASLLGCTVAAPPVEALAEPIDTLAYSVAEPGPYQCGHRVLETTYAPPGGLAERAITVDVWYPSLAVEGEHPSYLHIFQDKFALDDVPPAQAAFGAGLPVLVHSHGHKGFPGNSARLMCHAASHGWLAVAPEHVGDTLSFAPDPLPLSVYLQRPLDVRAALDRISALPAGDPLVGMADLSRVAFSGHSFGTYSGWAAGGAAFEVARVRAACDDGSVADCTEAQLQAFSGDLSEPRLSALVLMAGAQRAFFANGGYDAVKAPVLMMSGTLNPVGNDVIYESASKLDITWVEVDGGCHQLFGLGNTMLGGPECAVLPDEPGFAVVNPWVLAYVRYHTLGDRSAEVTGIVEGTTSFSPLVHVKHKRP